MPGKVLELLQEWTRGCIMAMALMLVAPLHAQPVPEHELKAAFVYNFILFTEWPADTVFEANTLNICASPTAPIRQALQGLDNKPVGSRRIAVRNTPAADELRRCHVLFVDHGSRDIWKKVRKELGMASVLTISDDEEIGNEGCIIALETEHGRIVFDIDLRAAGIARLVLSSKLLRLARTAQ